MKATLLITASFACVITIRAQAPSATLAGTRPSTPGAPEAIASPSPGTSPETSPASLVSPSASAAAGASPAESAAPRLNEILFKNFKARSIGPAAMGGRVSDIAIDSRNPAVFFVGLSTGGLFKTGDNGVTFDPVFDKQPVQSIGAVAVAPSDCDIVWVGTGEPTDRNSAEWGNGVYRSTDGAANWTVVDSINNTGASIVQVAVDAQNPAIVHDGRLFALPTDSMHLLIYDAATGETQARMPVADLDNADTLLGVLDDKLIVSGANSINCILKGCRRKRFSRKSASHTASNKIDSSSPENRAMTAWGADCRMARAFSPEAILTGKV